MRNVSSIIKAPSITTLLYRVKIFVKKRICKIIRSENRRVRGTMSERIMTCRRYANAYMFLACVCFQYYWFRLSRSTL